MEYLNLKLSPVRTAQYASLVYFYVHLAVREVFFDIDDQISSDLRLVHTSGEIGELRVLHMGEFSQVTTACLLKVCDQHIAVFHTALQMIERHNEFHVVDLSNCDDVQCKVHQFQISHLFADHFRGVNLHVPILLILGRLL